MAISEEYLPFLENEVSHLQGRAAFFYACATEYLASGQVERAVRCQDAAASYAGFSQIRLTQLLFGDETQIAAVNRMNAMEAA